MYSEPRPINQWYYNSSKEKGRRKGDDYRKPFGDVRDTLVTRCGERDNYEERDGKERGDESKRYLPLSLVRDAYLFAQ